MRIDLFMYRIGEQIFCKYCHKNLTPRINNNDKSPYRGVIGHFHAHKKEITKEFGESKEYVMKCKNCGKEKRINYREGFGDMKKYECKHCCNVRTFGALWRGKKLPKELIEKKKATGRIPENLNRRVAKMKKTFATPESKEKRSKASTRGLSNPETRKKLSDVATKAWEDGKHDKTIKRSKGEKEVLAYMQNQFPEDEWTFGGRFLLGYEDNKRQTLAFDCFSHKLKFVVEYDGPRHFIDFETGIDVEKPFCKDRLLEPWCKENGYKLIRISHSYYMQDKQLATSQIVDAVYVNNNFSCLKLGREYPSFR